MTSVNAEPFDPMPKINVSVVVSGVNGTPVELTLNVSGHYKAVQQILFGIGEAVRTAIEGDG